MNIHPIFVHFPIALLTIYAVLEILRFKKLTQNAVWFGIKAFLAIVGALASIVAFSTGDTAVSALRSHPELRQVLRVHESFATWTVTIFCIIGASYLIILIGRWWKTKPSYGRFTATAAGKAWSFLRHIAEYIQRPAIIVILALAGLFFITVTGTLGGLMVYGKASDPFVGLVAKLFFPTL